MTPAQKKALLEKNNTDRHDLESLVNDIKMNDETKKSLIEMKNNPNPENLNKTIRELKSDDTLNQESKITLFKILKENYFKLFSYVQKDFFVLVDEIKFFQQIAEDNIYLIAIRLSVLQQNPEMWQCSIKEEKDFPEKHRYKTFKSMVDYEFNYDYTTANRLINIVNNFDIATLQYAKISYTKVLPFLTIMNNEKISGAQKGNIKKRIYKEAPEKTVKEMQEIANEYIEHDDKNKRDVSPVIELPKEPDIKTTADLHEEFTRQTVLDMNPKQSEADKILFKSDAEIDALNKVVDEITETPQDNTIDWYNLKEAYNKISIPTTEIGKSYARIIYAGLKIFFENEE